MFSHLITKLLTTRFEIEIARVRNVWPAGHAAVVRRRRRRDVLRAAALLPRSVAVPVPTVLPVDARHSKVQEPRQHDAGEEHQRGHDVPVQRWDGGWCLNVSVAMMYLYNQNMHVGLGQFKFGPGFLNRLSLFLRAAFPPHI